MQVPDVGLTSADVDLTSVTAHLAFLRQATWQQQAMNNVVQHETAMLLRQALRGQKRPHSDDEGSGSSDGEVRRFHVCFTSATSF